MVWEGKDIVSSVGSDLVSLSIGQIVLALMIFSSYFGFALLVLGFELIHNKLVKKTSKSDLDQNEGTYRSQSIHLDTMSTLRYNMELLKNTLKIQNNQYVEAS